MSGIILLLVLAIWIYVVKKLSGFCVLKMQSSLKKTIVYYVVFTILLITPLVDEVIGKFQFNSLCSLNNRLIFNEDNLKGKTVRTKEVIQRKIHNIIPITEQTRKWLDVETEEILVVHKMYDAEGGWISRLIGYPDGRPYTFNGRCGYVDTYKLFQKLDVTKMDSK